MLDIKFPDAHLRKRCCFCNGNISEGSCIMCGRSLDRDHEIYVAERQRLPSFNWHSYHGEAGRIPKKEDGDDN